MIWTHTTINGRACSAADCNGKRLYVSQQYPDRLRFEAWVDSFRIGVFASAEAARKGCIASSAGVKVVAPKPVCAPIARGFVMATSSDTRKFDSRKYAAEPIIASTVECLAHPGIEMPSIEKLVAAPMPPIGYCKCGTKLGRSGRCPALCTPVTNAAPYTGPRTVGKTHTARLGAPVSW